MRASVLRYLWQARRRSPSPYIGWPSRLPFPNLQSLGAEYPAFSPLFQRDAPWVDADQGAIAQLPEDGALIRGPVHGYLRKADALLLYELAIHSCGDILEMGSAWGLSSCILARGAQNARHTVRVTSIELEPQFVAATRAALSKAGLAHLATVVPGDASLVSRKLVSAGRRFSLVFVDHDHGLPATQAVCELLPELLVPEGFAVFHDFNDERNRTAPLEYGVYHGVRQLAERGDFQFEGVMGCCAVLRKIP